MLVEIWLLASKQWTVEEDLDNLMAITKDITVQLDADGEATISPGDCGQWFQGAVVTTPVPFSLSLDKDTFTCDDVGTPVTVTLTATHGTNTATATALVTVEAAGNCEVRTVLLPYDPYGFYPKW